MMDDHCKGMPEMPGCEPYVALWKNKKMGDTEETSDTEDAFLSTPPSELPLAKPVEKVELQDGDTYTIEVTQVRKEIGNDEVALLAYNGSVP